MLSKQRNEETVDNSGHHTTVFHPAFKTIKFGFDSEKKLWSVAMDREIINAKQVWICSSHQNIVPSPAGWLEQSSIFSEW